ncbi:MAG: hypothetical protein AAF567_12470 [Actinomycetota bacterium]
MARPPIGSHAPAIELSTHAGRSWSLAEHRGRTVLIIFHRHIH